MAFNGRGRGVTESGIRLTKHNQLKPEASEAEKENLNAILRQPRRNNKNSAGMEAVRPASCIVESIQVS